MDDEEFFELSENYEEEENEDDEDDGVEFDVSKYVHKKVSSEDNREDADNYSEQDKEEEKLDEEEKLKRLQDAFSCLPKVLIKRILRRDDVKGDLNKASERLQEFQDMKSPHEFFKSPAAKPPEPKTFHEEHSEGQIPEAANEATKSGPFAPQNRIPPKVKPKRTGKRARNQGRGSGLQMEQEARVEGGGQWQWRDTEDAEYRGDRGRGRGGYDGQRRGGPRVGTGGGADGRFTQKEWYGSDEKNLIRGKQMDQNYQQTPLRSIYSGGEVGFKTQRGRGNRGGREYQSKPRGQDFSELRRSLQDQFQSFPQQFPYARERGASEGHREEFIRRRELPVTDRGDRNVDKPALNKGWISTDYESGEMVDIGRFAHGMYSVQSPPRRMIGNWIQGQGGMKQARSMTAINQTFDEHRLDETLNEQDTTKFEPKKLLVSGLDEKTTDVRVPNFIEAMSRYVVEEVLMLGKRRALVTMLQDISRIALPKNWTPMSQSGMTVHTVQLLRSSAEYRDVMRRVHATARDVKIQKIERVQNPHLYKSYLVLKEKIDKDNGGNNERQLFHGTSSNNISFINTQGFDRSHCGQHGTALGRGVYFARDASYSVKYAGGGPRGNCMYLARVLVGKYCQGNSSMMVPPAKDSSRPEILFESVVDCVRNPSIFVVFKDFQCYPEYLITF